MNSENFQKIIDKLQEYASLYGLKLIGAIVVLILGLWVIKVLVRIVTKGLDKRLSDPSLSSFLRSFISILLKVLLVISVMSMLGIQMTSFIAILGAAGLAVGLALSGMLQNFAGGVVVLIFKPFKVGDYIQALGHAGSVKEIQIFNTILNTPDNQIIIIPNGKIYSESIINYSREPQRRVDFTFGIGYNSNIEKARSVLKAIIHADERILKDPEPFIGLIELADSSVNLAVRVWVNSADYWGVFFSMNEAVFIEFNKEGISIPYPQMDVHITQNN
ncbi:MAG: mechanosensitive ion channel [Prolixibacteraceae bacterium]|nr:mechanosensitive ion channel [Prolixibacteraceae bacterium]